MKKIIILGLALLLFNCNGIAQQKELANKPFKVFKTDVEWKAKLSDLEYYVIRKAGTEPRYSSPFNKNKEKGTYVCKACDTPLFMSNYKYDSGSGWPSFDREIKGNVAFSIDKNIGYTRVEEHCATCGGHLGHMFNDGPKETTGKRHCVNGISLKFIPDNE